MSQESWKKGEPGIKRRPLLSPKGRQLFSPEELRAKIEAANALPLSVDDPVLRKAYAETAMRARQAAFEYAEKHNIRLDGV
jgi:hypothetical protein